MYKWIDLFWAWFSLKIKINNVNSGCQQDWVYQYETKDHTNKSKDIIKFLTQLRYKIKNAVEAFSKIKIEKFYTSIMIVFIYPRII